jgi:hypothetical protein
MEHHQQLITRFGVTSAGIPNEYLARKDINTCLYEPEDLLRDHFRDTLRDNTLESPSLESDMPRYNNGAKDVLNNRYQGARSAVQPNHPDMYLANTTRDERGSQTGVNMIRHKEGMKYRIERYKDLVSDKLSDQTEDSGVWEGPSVIKAQRSTWAKFKKRATWFDTSLSATYNPHNYRQSSTSKMKLITRDDNDKVRILSEVPSKLFTHSEVVYGKNHKKVIVGRRDVPTHRFTVAKYGRAPSSHKHKYDSRSKMDAAVPTADFKESEEAALKSLAIVMSAESGNACRDSAECTTSFQEGMKTNTDRHKGKQGNTRKALDEMQQTQDIVENMVVILESKNVRHAQDGDIAKRRGHKWYDQDIYDNVKESKHASIKLIADPFASARLKRYAITDIDGEDSMETVMYSSSGMLTIDQIRDAQRKGLIEYDNEESATVYRGQTGPSVSDRLNTIESVKATDETEFNDSAIKARTVGSIGEKSRIRRHVRYEPRSGLEDIDSRH